MQLPCRIFFPNRKGTYGDLMSRGGFVKVSRKILESDIIREPVTFTVFMYLLLSAGYRSDQCCRQEIKRGEVVTSYPRIALATGVTERQARTALSKLVKSGRVSVRKYPKFSVVTLLNYEKYQGMSGKKSPKSQSNDRQQVSQMSPLKEIKNNKEINNNSSCSSNYIENFHKDDCGGLCGEKDDEAKLYRWSKGQRVMLSELQVAKLLEILSLDEFNFYVDKLDRFIAEKNAAVKNHYETILKWATEDRGV